MAPDFFPIAVWLQDPAHAAAYKKAGINLFVGLWNGPTEGQLKALSKAGMKVICSQTQTGLKHIDDPAIIAWMHDDEPDNAQPKQGEGYGPPVDPAHIKELYRLYKERDPSRPVYLNLGQGVAWHEWIGRGVDTGTTHNYPRYIEGTDIVSFDIYPANTKDKVVHDKLQYAAKGVMNLRKWSGDTKPVWCWIETTRISQDSPDGPTPDQVRSEVWMAIIHGAKGVGYFCHSWYPKVDDAALLHDSDMLKAVSRINSEINSLATILNSPSFNGIVTVRSDTASSPIDTMVKRGNDGLYIFTISMGDKPANGTFNLSDFRNISEVGAFGEDRKLALKNGQFEDRFPPYGVHIYKIK